MDGNGFRGEEPRPGISCGFLMVFTKSRIV
jgi:hypothetical protein